MLHRGLVLSVVAVGTPGGRTVGIVVSTIVFISLGLFVWRVRHWYRWIAAAAVLMLGWFWLLALGWIR